MYQLILLAIFCGSTLATGPVSLPSTFKLCSRRSAELNNCLKSSIQSAMVDLVKGVKPLGVLSVDPLRISNLDIVQGAGSNVAVQLHFSELDIFGIGGIVIKSVDAQLDGDVKKLTIKVSIPNVVLKSKYTIKGKVLILPISGNGDSEIKLTGGEATIAFTGKIVTNEGKKYLVFSSVKFYLNPAKVIFYFQNLFNGDKALGDNMNKFLNENWEVVYTELKEPIQKAFASTFIEITNRIFTKVPFDDIFLP